MKSTKEIPNYFIAYEDDYHDFGHLQDKMQNYLNLLYEYKEIGLDPSSHLYVAVFWLVGTSKPKNLIKELGR